MILTIIFIVAIATSFLTASYRAWQIRTYGAEKEEETINYAESFSFRNIEKVVLYWANRIVVGSVGFVVTHWFTMTTKIRKWVEVCWPRVHDVFTRRPASADKPKPYSFTKRTIIESKIKIKRIKEKVRREHE